MMSLDASGTLGDAITFSKWKGRPYVRERVVPSNPKSGAQIGRRTMFKFLTQEWDGLSAPDKATYQDLADQLVASPFNAFLSYNMGRYHNFLAPAKPYPAAEDDAAGNHTLQGAAWQENRIAIAITGATLNQNWGFAIHAYTSTAFTPAVGNLIMCIQKTDVLAQTVYWTPPSKVQWFFNSHAMSLHGVKAAAGGEQNAAP